MGFSMDFPRTLSIPALRALEAAKQAGWQYEYVSHSNETVTVSAMSSSGVSIFMACAEDELPERLKMLERLVDRHRR